MAPAAALGLVILAGPILATIFRYREFTSYDVDMAGVSLMAYAIGLPAFILIKVLATGFFSRQDTATPVKVGAIAMVTNVVFNLLLVGPLLHAGLALATSMSAYLNAGLLYYHLNKHRYYQPQAGWGVYFLKLGIALAVMAVVLLEFVPDLNYWYQWSVLTRVSRLVFWVIAGAAVYLLTLIITGIRPRQMISHP